MQKITNLTNSPFELQSAEGMVRLPAFGSIEGDFAGEYLDVLRASGAVSVGHADSTPIKAPSKSRAARKTAAQRATATGKN